MSNNLEKEKNFIVELIPFGVKDISNYKIGMSVLGEETTLVTNLTITDLLTRLISRKSYPRNIYLEKQVILVYFTGNGKYFTSTRIWEYVHEANIIPTFAFNYIASDSYNHDTDENEETFFIFGYVLDAPVSELEIMNGIKNYLSENVFIDFASEYGADVFNLNFGDYGLFDNITGTYISNNIYVPVEGGLTNVKE